MKNKKIIVLFLVAILIALPLLNNCKGDVEDPVTNDPVIDVQLLSPSNEQQFNIGEKISVSIKVNDPKVSDLKLYVEDTIYQEGIPSSDNTISIDSKNSKVGQVRIRLSYINADGELKGDSRMIVLFSDVQPLYKSAKIVKIHPHNPTSYTQGLEFYKGNLFEGTGQRGQSILGEVNLETGEHKRKQELEPRFFGEGITILNDTIYQLTYQAGVCKVYDLKFNEINEFTYTGEGWGLCNNGTDILMSNGSSEIVWRDPRTFTIKKRLQVFDPRKEIVNLNELELIDGRLFANIYTDKQIVEIDTANGKILSYIDCSELVKDATGPGTDVLNGIAYNSITKKLYLTGKLWPKMYEVTIE
ncbi:MAG: glutaminyl-peptide cyclotransferase [Crocinitomicaceae bacterium]